MEVNKIIQGDCLAALENIPDDFIDLVCTDPPYSSGARQTTQLRKRKGMVRSERWKEEWFGTDNLSTSGFLFFFRGVALQLFKKLKPGAHAYFFIDWRNYPLLTNVLESCGFRIGGMVVWDKEIFGMGAGFRNQHELIIVSSKGSPREFNRHDLANVIRVRRIKSEIHPTEKPVELLAKLIEMSTNVNDLVLDPFSGSGATAVAAKQLGRRYMGIELNPEYVKIAEQRLAEVQKPLLSTY